MRLIRILPLFLFTVIAVLLLLNLDALRHQEPLDSGASDIATPWPSLTLQDAAARPLTLDTAALQHKVTVVNLFASWCAPCKAEMPELKLLQQQTGAIFIGIAWNDTPKVIDAWLKEAGNPFQRVAYDSTGTAAIALGLRGVPETFIIDKRGIIRRHIAGVVSPDLAQEQLLPLLRQLQQEE